MSYSFVRSLALLAPFCVVLALPACSKDDDTSDSSGGSTDNYADESDALSSSNQAESVDSTLFGNVKSADPDTASDQIGGDSAQWWPAACSTREVDTTNKKVVRIHLDNCSGPFGMRKWNGTFIVTLSKNDDGSMHGDVAVDPEDPMTVNGKAVSYTGSRDVTINGEIVSISGSMTWTRENAKGETIVHEREGTIEIDRATHCRTGNGTGTTSVGNRAKVTSTLEDVKVCRTADNQDACPESGTITHTKGGNTVSIEFDGSAEATLTGPRGNTVQVPLVCEAND